MEAAPERGENDEQVVARFQGGDDSAFDELVRRHRSAVYRLAYRLMGTHQDADDLAQEAFLRSYRGLRGFRGEALFRTWITRIVVNQAINMRQARRPAEPLTEAVMEGRDDGPVSERAALRAQVRRAVDHLPRRQRQVLVLKVYEGLKFIEIARAAGIATGTAKATYFQAVRGLRQRLAGAGGPQGGGRGGP
jgi:RNA polymerase sigma-70 factor (ECF subfamily)